MAIHTHNSPGAALNAPTHRPKSLSEGASAPAPVTACVVAMAGEGGLLLKRPAKALKIALIELLIII